MVLNNPTPDAEMRNMNDLGLVVPSLGKLV
jgi:hypothetical protein